MKQVRHLTLVLAQTLCVVILIASAAGPTDGQEKNEQIAELVVQTGHTDHALYVDFSPDGNYLASSNQFNTKLWNITTGQELRTLSGGGARFSPDGNTLATFGTNQLKLWNWRTGQELRSLQPVITVSSIAFSPKGEVLASVDGITKTIKLWDVKSGKQLRVLAGHTGLIGSVVFSPDGKTLASDSADKTIKLWNWQTGEQLRSISAYIFSQGFFRSIAFSPNGEMIAGQVIAGKITLWDTATGQKLRELGQPSFTGISSIAFCEGGKALATVSNGLGDMLDNMRTRPDLSKPLDRTTPAWRVHIKLLDVQTGQELRRIELDTKEQQLPGFQFSPDDKTLAIVGADSNPKLLDAVTARELRKFAGYTAQVTAAGSSVDNSLLASGSADGNIRLWDIEKGRQIRTFNDHDSAIKQIVFSRDNQVMGSATDEVIKLWQVETGKLLKSLQISDPATQKQVEAVFPDFYQRTPYETLMGKFRLYGGENGQLNIYDEDTQTPLVSLVSLNENDWAAITPQGLFDASLGARRLMHYVSGLEPIQLEQMKDLYYVPGLLEKIFKGNPLPKVELFSSADLFPLAEYQPPKPGQTSLTVKLTNRGGGIGPVKVLINKKECGGDALPPNFAPHQPSVTLQIDLAKCGLLIPGKQNVVEVVTRNAAGSLNSRGSSRGVEIVGLSGGTAPVSAPQIYAIIAGVSDYTGNDLDLSYAAKDAEDFAKAFDVGASKLFGADRVHIRLLTSNGAKSGLAFSSNDARTSTATKADLTKVFEEFKKASSNDVFIVYLAGHGVSLNLGQNPSLAAGDTYLYLTQEATTTQALSDKKSRDAMTISSDELAELMKRNKALKQVLILDTCAAGAATTSLAGKRNLPSDQIKAIERLQDRIGFFVLMGAAADKVSYEATQYDQGLLTYSLLQGMRGAKLRDEKFADITMLFNYAQDTVPSLAKNIGGIQRPIVIMPERSGIVGESGSFDIGMFTAGEIAKLNKPTSPKPFVVRPILIEANENYDKLGLTPLLRQALRETETSFAFIDADEMIDAIKPSGSYAIKGDDVIVTLRLTRNDAPLGKTLTINGKLAEKKLLIEKIVAAIIQTGLPK
jgi:WD40 repeat protein